MVPWFGQTSSSSIMGRVKAFAQWALRNLDSAITIVLAGTFAVLSLLSLGSVRTVLAGALIVMVLLSVANLRDRGDRDQLRELISQLDGSVAKIRAFQERAHDAVVVAENEAADARQLQELIGSLPKIQSADLIAFSGRDARGILEEILRHSGCPIRLLMKHPDSVGRIQRQWIVAELERMQRYLVPEYSETLHIRCYRAPYSLRGRKLHPYLINVGWYTPLIDDEVEVVGHTNPLVIAKLDTPEGASLCKMFDTLFEALWNASTTEDAATVMSGGEGSPADKLKE
jgi:hypothetical protein